MIYLELFWTFFKIGLFTFGGGYAMLPLIQAEVLAHNWMSSTEIVNFIAVSESTPGPLAVNMATYVGRVTAGVGGSACATLGVVLPSFLIILFIAGAYERYRKSKLVKGIMSGIRPAVIGLIAASLFSIGKEIFVPTAETPGFLVLLSLVIFAAMAVLSLRKVHPIRIIAISAAIGIAVGYLSNGKI